MTLHVTFRSLGRSKRVWTAAFQMGSVIENRGEALRVAWCLNAEILETREG